MSSNLPRMVPFRTCSPLSEGLMGGRWRCWAHVLRSVEAVLSGVGAASRGLRKGAIGPRSSEDSTATLGSPAGSPGARHSVCSRKSRSPRGSGGAPGARACRCGSRRATWPCCALPWTGCKLLLCLAREALAIEVTCPKWHSELFGRFSDRSEESSDPPGTPPSAATAPLARVHFNFLSKVRTYAPSLWIRTGGSS